MLGKGLPVSNERRGSTRFGKDRGADLAVIRCPNGEELVVEVHDESLGGISLYLPDIASLKGCQEFDLVYAGETLRASLRHEQSHEDGGFILGFACERIKAV